MANGGLITDYLSYGSGAPSGAPSVASGSGEFAFYQNTATGDLYVWALNGTPAWTLVSGGGGGGGLVLGVTEVDLTVDETGLNATTKWTDFPTMTTTITPASSASRFMVAVSGVMNPGAGGVIFLGVKVGSLTTKNVAGTQAANTEDVVSGTYVFAPATSSSITIKLQYFVSAGTTVCRPASFPDNENLSMVITELAS